MKTVWIYVDTSKQVGDRDHLKVFANSDLADEWFLVNDPEGAVFEYEVIGAVMTKLSKAADGIAKTEVDHHRKCSAAGSGSICAAFVKCSSIS
ncbi:hypothetical protein IVA95_13305 [Bradyrhizobium sp. 157]|uniref:hypothetical protein n=1 Tax=Bradyrhizobium sp. 157 TaxID=2782631 RepID=UPI001FFBA38C|nr:hypothetical protein [Bradyrhizobium sp. 157]MCK1638550.1 hypothetical protein [Bradyrhizobium sp. 157]